MYGKSSNYFEIVRIYIYFPFDWNFNPCHTMFSVLHNRNVITVGCLRSSYCNSELNTLELCAIDCRLIYIYMLKSFQNKNIHILSRLSMEEQESM